GSPCTARIRSMNACTTCAGLASAGGGVQPLRAAADASHTASKTARERITFAYRACPTTATPIWSAQFGLTCPRLAGSGPMGSEIFLRWAGRPLKWQPAALPRSAQHVLEQGSPDLRFVSGDNLQVLSNLAPELRGQVTLVYLDPPFLTNKVHARVHRHRDAAGKVERTEVAAFDDRWDSLSEYLEHLGPRLEALRETLADHGSMVLHVDTKTSHYLKVLCDEIFGPDAFASEVVWRYRRWPAKTRNFQRVHDVLLRYVRNPAANVRFNQLYEPLAPSTRATWGTGKQRAVTEPDGRRVRSTTTAT